MSEITSPSPEIQSNSSSASSDNDPDPPIHLRLPPLSYSLFDAEPSEPNGVVHGSASSEPPKPSQSHEVVIRGSSEPPSPSSSGYAGERGSSSATSISAADDLTHHEIEELSIHDDPLPPPTSLPGKRNADEDDASISWRKRKKHFFVLSHSGKPIYSRYGDEHKLAGFSATLQAIISFVENGGDRVKLVRAGNHQVVFLVKGPIYLVCISCTEEPYESLRGQLELIYGQESGYISSCLYLSAPYICNKASCWCYLAGCCGFRCSVCNTNVQAQGNQSSWCTESHTSSR